MGEQVWTGGVVSALIGMDDTPWVVFVGIL